MAALRVYPRMFAATHGLVFTLLQQGMIDEAIDLAGKFVAGGSSIGGYELVARALVGKRRFADARLHLFRAFHLLSGRSEPGCKTGARRANNLAVCYWHLGNRSEARRFLERA